MAGAIVVERIEAALANPDVRKRAEGIDLMFLEEPTVGQVLGFLLITGLDPLLLLCGVEDVERGLDDLPRFDSYRVTEGDEL